MLVWLLTVLCMLDMISWMAKHPIGPTSHVNRDNLTSPSHELPLLVDDPHPSERLYQEITQRLGSPGWELSYRLLGNEIAKHTRIARGTVTRTLGRLHSEGILEPLRGKGYRIVGIKPLLRSTSVVSVSSFAEEKGLQVGSVLDRESCKIYPLAKIPMTELAEGDGDLRSTLRSSLSVDDDERILIVRRARSFSGAAVGSTTRWAILETLFLVERKVGNLQQALTARLPALESGERTPKVSLHSGRHVPGRTPARSE